MTFPAIDLAFVTRLISPTAAADWTDPPPILFLRGDDGDADSTRYLRSEEYRKVRVWCSVEAV